MSEQPRFTLTLRLDDNYGSEPPAMWAIGVDEAMSISSRAVDEIKAGLVPFEHAVRIMRTREMRRKVLIELAKQLAAQMADRLEDSEGWHDPDRIDPAREALKTGGSLRRL